MDQKNHKDASKKGAGGGENPDLQLLMAMQAMAQQQQNPLMNMAQFGGNSLFGNNGAGTSGSNGGGGMDARNMMGGL